MKKLHPAGAVWLNGHWLIKATSIEELLNLVMI